MYQLVSAKEKISKINIRPDVWMNPNGTFSHRRDVECEWREEDSCRFDLKLTLENDRAVRLD